MANVAAAQERAERAGRLLGAADTLSSLPVNFLSEAGRIDLDQDMAQARTHLNKAAFDAGWADGQAMTQAQAISYAVQDDTHKENLSGTTTIRLHLIGSISLRFSSYALVCRAARLSQVTLGMRKPA